MNPEARWNKTSAGAKDLKWFREGSSTSSIELRQLSYVGHARKRYLADHLGDIASFSNYSVRGLQCAGPDGAVMRSHISDRQRFG